MHFDFSCGNTTQYYFLCIFETFGRMKLKHLILFVFLILIIQNHKKKIQTHTHLFLLYFTHTPTIINLQTIKIENNPNNTLNNCKNSQINLLRILE